MQSSSDRGQTEPLAALVAVFALGVGLSMYVGVLDSTLPLFSSETDITPTAADKLVAESSSFGSVRPPIEGSVADSRPSGYRLNATLRADGMTWTGGPPIDGSADCLQRSVSVRTDPGRIRSGVLGVCTWPAQ